MRIIHKLTGKPEEMVKVETAPQQTVIDSLVEETAGMRRSLGLLDDRGDILTASVERQRLRRTR